MTVANATSGSTPPTGGRRSRARKVANATFRRDVPAFASRRHPKRATYAERVEAHHYRLTGHPLMPWQRDVCEVAMEYGPDGRLTHRYVVVKTPRQSGKTSLGDAVLIGRCLEWPTPQQVLLMAQDRNMSRYRLLDEIAGRRLRACEWYDGRWAERRLTGSEQIAFDTGSFIAIAAVTKDAGHGLTLDTAYIDEVWTHEDFRALQALSPTMTTRPDPQIWLVSTEGVEESTVLDYWTALGRESVGDPESNIAYFEWSKPDDADPYDESRWPEYMPALGHTQTVEAIRAEAQTLPELEFLRAFCNVRTSLSASVFPLGVWEACGDESYEPAGMLSAAVDVSPDRARACVVVCGERTVEVVEDRPGTEWVVARMLELDSRWGFRTTVIDNAGPVVSLASELEYRGVRVTRTNATDYKAACGRFYDAVVSGQLRHRGQQVLTDAVYAAKRRNLLDAWAWSRKGAGYIAPVVAATLAYWGWSEEPAETEVGIW